MESKVPCPLSLSARDVVALNDAELDRYLEEHRCPGGERIVDVVDGWGDVPKDQQDRFIQRLRDRIDTTKTVRSRPVDLDEVSRRLLSHSTENTSSPPSEYQLVLAKRRTSTPPAESDEEFETENHADLDSEGGRPCYPLSLLGEVARNPEKYSDMLSPWRDGDDWMVFGKQLGSWREFRHWQNYNRRDFSESRAGLFTKCKLAQRAFVREFRLYGTGLREYHEAITALLARHNFHRTFRLEKDPKKEDKLSTWIEYLGYEYWRHDWSAHYAEYMRPLYDDAWKELVESKLLRSFETEEFILSDACSFRHQSEETAARNALKATRSVAETRDAHSRYNKAKEAFELVVRRNTLVTKFHKKIRLYKSAKQEVVRHKGRAQWILEQIPLVEAELNTSVPSGSPGDKPRDRKRGRRTDENETADNRPLKKRRGNDQRIVFEQTLHRNTRIATSQESSCEGMLRRLALSKPGSAEATSMGSMVVELEGNS